VGSSRRRRSGWAKRTAASATRIRQPPEKSEQGWRVSSSVKPRPLRMEVARASPDQASMSARRVWISAMRWGSCACGIREQRLALGVGGEDGVEEGDVVAGNLLRDAADAGAAGDLDGAGVERELAPDEAEERGLAGAVAAHEADLVAGGDDGRGVLEERAAVHGIGDVVEAEHRGACARGKGAGRLLPQGGRGVNRGNQPGRRGVSPARAEGGFHGRGSDGAGRLAPEPLAARRPGGTGGAHGRGAPPPGVRGADLVAAPPGRPGAGAAAARGRVPLRRGALRAGGRAHAGGALPLRGLPQGGRRHGGALRALALGAGAACTAGSSTHAGRSFCPACGSHVLHAGAEVVTVLLGTLDEAPNDLVPAREIWTVRREPWAQPVPAPCSSSAIRSDRRGPFRLRNPMLTARAERLGTGPGPARS
jgi:hypothetical protein